MSNHWSQAIDNQVLWAGSLPVLHKNMILPKLPSSCTPENERKLLCEEGGAFSIAKVVVVRESVGKFLKAAFELSNTKGRKKLLYALSTMAFIF